MNVYLDASVLLRVALRQKGALPDWRDLGSPVASAVIQVECFRTLDRFRLINGLDDAEVFSRRTSIQSYLGTTFLVSVTDAILLRATQPFPFVLATLDAIHLATALLWREERGENLTFATHDARLAAAVRAYDFPVIGVR